MRLTSAERERGARTSERANDNNIQLSVRRCLIINHQSLLWLWCALAHTMGSTRARAAPRVPAQSHEKISNKSSFGIIDIAESSTSDRIIVIVEMARFIHRGAS